MLPKNVPSFSVHSFKYKKIVKHLTNKINPETIYMFVMSGIGHSYIVVVIS